MRVRAGDFRGARNTNGWREKCVEGNVNLGCVTLVKSASLTLKFTLLLNPGPRLSVHLTDVACENCRMSQARRPVHIVEFPAVIIFEGNATGGVHTLRFAKHTQ